jgi:hypothetical protein
MSVFDEGNKTGASPALADWSANGNYHKWTLTGNVTGTPTFTNPSATGAVLAQVIQDGTGGRTMVWPTSVIWDKGVAPTLSTAAGAVDLAVLVWDGTNYRGTFFYGTSNKAQQFARVSGSNVSNSSNVTWADITGLSFSVDANVNYEFEAVLFYQTAATTTGARFGVSAPASPTALLAGSNSLPTGTAAMNAGAATANDTAFFAATTGPGGTTVCAIVKGILRNGANAGTLKMRLISEVNTSAVTVLIDSYMYLRPF